MILSSKDASMDFDKDVYINYLLYQILRLVRLVRFIDILKQIHSWIFFNSYSSLNVDK